MTKILRRFQWILPPLSTFEFTFDPDDLQGRIEKIQKEGLEIE